MAEPSCIHSYVNNNLIKFLEILMVDEIQSYCNVTFSIYFSGQVIKINFIKFLMMFANLVNDLDVGIVWRCAVY